MYCCFWVWWTMDRRGVSICETSLCDVVDLLVPAVTISGCGPCWNFQVIWKLMFFLEKHNFSKMFNCSLHLDHSLHCSLTADEQSLIRRNSRWQEMHEYVILKLAPMNNLPLPCAFCPSSNEEGNRGIIFWAACACRN